MVILGSLCPKNAAAMNPALPAVTIAVAAPDRKLLADIEGALKYTTGDAADDPVGG